GGVRRKGGEPGGGRDIEPNTGRPGVTHARCQTGPTRRAPSPTAGTRRTSDHDAGARRTTRNNVATTAIAMSVWGIFAFWMCVVTARRVTDLTGRVAALERRASGPPGDG